MEVKIVQKKAGKKYNSKMQKKNKTEEKHNVCGKKTQTKLEITFKEDYNRPFQVNCCKQ